MNIALAVWILSVLLLANCGLSKETKGLHGEHHNYKAQSSMGDDIVKLDETVPFKPCFNYREQIKHKLRSKTFIPLCGVDGYYAPLQCHSSTGYCWCVDRLGKEINGTRIKGLAYCGLQNVKRPCKRHRLRALSSRSKFNSQRSVYLPHCDEDGYYSPLQCLDRNKQCWCVNKDGKMKKGSRTRGLTKCEDSSPSKAIDLFSVPIKPSNNYPCLRHKKKIRNLIAGVQHKVWDPNCDEKGYYDDKQCHNSYCWCVNRDGEMIKGTRNKGDVDCETEISSGPTRKDCLVKRLEALKTSLFVKPFIPLCEPDGTFSPLQCHVYKGDCWCVDKEGDEIDGSRTKRTPNCFSKVISKAGKRPCHLHISYIQKLPFTKKTYIPICKENGFFQQRQCSSNNDYCWCVNYGGTEIKGSLTIGKSSCPEILMNLTDVITANKPSRFAPCIRHKNTRKNMVSILQRKPFNPSCAEDGYYSAKQCHNGHCWCSNRDGNMIAGTRKKGDIECDLSSLTKKNCATKRIKAQKVSMFVKPFIPLCEPNGNYSPLQCDVYKGICWCVDKAGEEIAGSRTKRTPNCFSNVFNTIHDGPCHLLKSHIEKLPFTKMVHEPKCESNGFFQPAQCSENKMYCWCVMHDGTEIEGSITFGKPRCREKPAPAVPKVRGPCEDHMFHVKNLISDRDVYTPICDEKGFYVTRQCNNRTNYCWCVDRYGVMVKGTRMQGLPVCGEEALEPCHAFKRKIKEYVPVCTEKGYFAPLQCNVQKGDCWCVDKMGVKEPGSNIYERPYCGTEERSCELQRRLLLSTNRTETPVPSCDLHGYYSSIQCDVFTDECWCSDRGGNEITESRTKETPECGQIPRPCDEHASRTSNYDYIFGVYIPQCDSEGYYKNIQCHEKTNMCWCSSRIGAEIPGTKTSGRPNCTEKRISR